MVGKERLRCIFYLIETFFLLVFKIWTFTYLCSSKPNLNKSYIRAGAVMEELAGRLLSLKKCEFRPRHKNNLANEFICLCSYDLNSYLTNS